MALIGSVKGQCLTKTYLKILYLEASQIAVITQLSILEFPTVMIANGFVFILLLVNIVISFVPVLAHFSLGQVIHINHVQQISTFSVIILFLVTQFDWHWMTL